MAAATPDATPARSAAVQFGGRSTVGWAHAIPTPTDGTAIAIATAASVALGLFRLLRKLAKVRASRGNFEISQSQRKRIVLNSGQKHALVPM